MESALLAGEAAMRRDPRESPWGVLLGGEFLHEGTEVFMWFASAHDLVGHLLDVEPRLLASLAAGDDIEAYRDRIRIPLEQVLTHGLSEEARAAFNAASEGFMVVQWWGRFQELALGESEVSRDLLSWFRAAAGAGAQPVAPLADEELDGFVAFLRSL